MSITQVYLPSDSFHFSIINGHIICLKQVSLSKSF